MGGRGVESRGLGKAAAEGLRLEWVGSGFGTVVYFVALIIISSLQRCHGIYGVFLVKYCDLYRSNGPFPPPSSTRRKPDPQYTLSDVGA